MKPILIGLFWAAIAAAIFWFVRRSNQKAALQKKEAAERKERERLKLIEVYGEEDGMAIFNKTIHQGFSGQMVLYAWGHPAHKTEKVNLNKISQRWWFGQYTTDRGTVKYRTYVDLVNDEVVGWGDVTK